MIRLWVKTIKNNRVQLSYIYESIDNFHAETFYLHINEICHRLDIPSPVVLNYHINNFINFSSCRFKPTDFVESVNFDKFEIEDATLR